MPLTRRAASLAALAASLPTALAAAPAQAAGSCTLYAPTKIAVSSYYRAVPVRWGGDCSGVLDAYWTAFHPSMGPEAGVAYRDSSFDMYDFFDRGVWTWRGEGAYDSNYDDVWQNSPRTDVRLATSGYLTLAKSGTTVNAYTRTSRYSPYYGKWIGYQPTARAYLQWRSLSGSYVNLKALYPDKYGVYRYRFTATKQMYYRIWIPDSQAGGTWGTYSPGQLK